MQKNIDEAFSKELLDKLKNKSLKFSRGTFKSIPDYNSSKIYNLCDNNTHIFNKDLAFSNLSLYIKNYEDFGTLEGDKIVYTNQDLENLGLALYPYVAFGFLNGGAASSYVDIKKNREFNEDLFSLFESKIYEGREKYSNLPKALTPAFINEDGTYSYNFLAMKLRNILFIANKYYKVYKKQVKPIIFQMTSHLTDEALEKYLDNSFNEDLIYSLNRDENFLKISDILSASQPLLYSFNEESNDFFTYKNSKNENLKFALPGGHGQNFKVLKAIYQNLYKRGKRFAFLGNIDNLGYTVNLKTIAIMALKNSNASFEFSKMTILDKKGGILALNNHNKLTCLDIGSGIDSATFEKLSSREENILFNCATGLFNLKYLNSNIDYIIENMPIRLINQNKDIGKYNHIEQVTWEVIELIKDPLIFSVNRNERFLPAKLFTDMLFNSGFLKEKYPKKYLEIANYLNNTLYFLLKNDYFLTKRGQKWLV